MMNAVDQTAMNRLLGIKLLLIILVLGSATFLKAAKPTPKPKPTAKPVPWHVKNAEIRIPVKVTMKDALLRMPPQVYIADLKPLERTGGLAFNPKTKSALHRDLRKPEEKAASIAKEKERYKKTKTTWDPKAYSRLGEKEGGPILRISGSVTVAIKPEYKYFSWSGAAKVTIDGKLLPEDSLLQVTWKEGESRYYSYKERKMTRLAPIPPGAKTLKLEINAGARGRFSQAGFITRSPGVARATICVPGRDPSLLVPITHRLGGERVGCRTVWAEAGKPMSIFFDSSNDRSYALKLIDSSLTTHPMLRLDPEFMVSVVAVYASMGDPRAAILAEQMLEAEMNDGQRRILIMTQVKIKINAGDLPGAAKVFRILKKLAPQSDETIQARELIKAAVIKK